MGDLQGLMVFICSLSKHGSRAAPSTQYRPPWPRPTPQLSPSSLHFSTSEFQLKLSSRVVYIFQLNILYFLPEIGRRSVRFCLWYSNLVGARLFLLSRHLQSSSSLHLISPRVFPRQNWFILVLIK